MKLRRIVPVLAVSALAVSGCAQVGNSTAATVNGSPISTSDINLLASGTCAQIKKQAQTNPQAASQVVPMATMRSNVASTLIQAELAADLAKERGVKFSAEQQSMLNAQVNQAVSTFPKGDQPVYKAQLSKIFEGRALLALIGAKKAGRDASLAGGQQLQQLGGQELRKYAAKADIVTNPKFGLDKEGQIDPDSGLSVPASTLAKDGQQAAKNPQSPSAASFIRSLPANLKCG